MSKILIDKILKQSISSNGYAGLYIKNTNENHIGPTFLHIRLSSNKIYCSKRG
jgi:hypothetical protein